MILPLDIEFRDLSVTSVEIPEPSPDQLFDMVARYCGLPPYDVRPVPRIVSVSVTPVEENCEF